MKNIFASILPVSAFSLAALVACCGFAAAAPSIDDCNVIWDTPSKNSLESMMIGNGDIGLNVWVEPSGDLIFFIGKTDAWDENVRLLKLGKVRVKFTPALTTSTGFRQELKLRDGVMEVQTPQAKVRVWVDANHPTIQVDAESLDGQPLAASAAFEMWRTTKRPMAGNLAKPGSVMETSSTGFTSLPPINYPDTVLTAKGGRIGWYHRNVVSPWLASLKLQKNEEIAKIQQDPILNLTTGAILHGENWTAASATELKTTRPAKELSLRIDALTRITDTPVAWLDALEAQAATVQKMPVAGRWDAHVRWWHEFWDRSWILADGSPDAINVTRACTLQRWVNACGGRGAYPIKFNGSIFTVDTTKLGADYRDWGGCYWLQNTRHPYYSMLAAGDFDLMPSFFKMYMDALPARQLATKNYYGHEGAFFPETMTFWGNYIDQGSFGYGIDRRKLADGMIQNGHTRNLWEGSLEVAALMFEYYYYTGDEKFLKQTALPFAHEIVTFYDKHFKRDAAGKILLDPLNALEDIWSCQNPMTDVAGLRANLTALIALTGDTSKQTNYKRMLAEMPAFPATTGPDGKPRFAPCSSATPRRNNSEKPELYNVYPHLLHGVGRPDFEMAREAWKYSHKTYMKMKPAGWSQDPIFLACLGFTDEAKEQLVWRAGLVQPGSRFPAFWGKNFDWMPDQDHGTINLTAFQKMVIQPDFPGQSDQIFLLPAWPKDWNCSFKLRAPKNTTVEGEVKDGKLVNFKVTPESRHKDIRVRQGDDFVPYP